MQFSSGFLRVSSSGKFVGVLKYRDATGVWRQVTRTFGRNRAEAEEALAAWRSEMEGVAPPAAPAAPVAPPVASAASQTVEQAVRGCLAAQLARGRIERSTHDTQLARAERSLFPQLGAVPLAALTPVQAQAWVDGLCLQLSAGSVRLAYGTLHKACAWAVVRGELARNPLEHVEPPGRARPSRVYLPARSVELLEQAIDAQWGPSSGNACAARLALYAGLRAGEACALRWRDVDLRAGRLRVAASVGRSGDGFYLKGPKCAASARELPVVSPLARALEMRAAVEGGAPGGDCFVTGEGDACANPRSLSNAFARLCDRAGVTDSAGRRATFHTLRHTFATRAVRAGVDIRTLADLMGHARADVTLNVYAATAEDALQVAAERLERALGAGAFC